MTSPRLEARLTGYSSTALSVFRIIVGLLFAIHGYVKVFGVPFGEPMPVGSWPVWWAGLIELVTGLLVAIGFATRPAAFLACGHMAVAYFWRHWPPLEGEPASFWPHENGGELAVLYCFAFLLILFMGPGRLSVDARRRPVGGTAVAGTAVAGTALAGTAAPPARPGLLSRFRRGGVRRRY